MTVQEAIEILDNHNKWRRSKTGSPMPNSPTRLGIAIDIVLEEVRKPTVIKN